MRTTPTLAFAALHAAALAFAGPAHAGGFPHDDWTAVLAAHVDERGFVSYDALAKDRAILDRYLAALEKTSPSSSPELFPTSSDRLAYWLNAYNALVFKGVLSRGPERESVWKGGLFSGYSFFVGTDVVLGGRKTSLKKLEDDVIRRGFADPRVHAALNCASKSCPRLPQTAFLPGILDTQLDAAMREFVAENRNVAIDVAAKTATLSKIFDWFDDDFLAFEKAKGNARGTVRDYVNRWRGPLPKIPEGYRIRFAEYDKSVNRR